MRRQHTFIAISLMLTAGSMPTSKAHPTPFNPRASMGSNPMFIPSKGQRVKNKLHKKYYK